MQMARSARLALPPPLPGPGTLFSFAPNWKEKQPMSLSFSLLGGTFECRLHCKKDSDVFLVLGPSQETGSKRVPLFFFASSCFLDFLGRGCVVSDGARRCSSPSFSFENDSAFICNPGDHQCGWEDRTVFFLPLPQPSPRASPPVRMSHRTPLIREVPPFPFPPWPPPSKFRGSRPSSSLPSAGPTTAIAQEIIGSKPYEGRFFFFFSLFSLMRVSSLSLSFLFPSLFFPPESTPRVFFPASQNSVQGPRSPFSLLFSSPFLFRRFFHLFPPLPLPTPKLLVLEEKTLGTRNPGARASFPPIPQDFSLTILMKKNRSLEVEPFVSFSFCLDSSLFYPLPPSMRPSRRRTTRSLSFFFFFPPPVKKFL